MRVLVACEYSGRVRDAFLAACSRLRFPGRTTWADVRDVLEDGWDLMIAHPPCTDLAVSGNAHMAAKIADGRVAAGIAFVRLLLNAPIERIAVENPVSVIASHIRPADQYFQPWQFGHGETKKTGLWLKNLPPLVPTDIVEGREQRVWLMPPSADRWKERSRTFEGVAAAMASQWGQALPSQGELFGVAS